jgi:hypothetical protein
MCNAKGKYDMQGKRFEPKRGSKSKERWSNEANRCKKAILKFSDFDKIQRAGL